MTAVSGRAICSSSLRSAATPSSSSTMPPTIMRPPPMAYPMNSRDGLLPAPMSAPNRIGPTAPNTWAIAKNTAIASARISTGKVSLTVR